MSSKSPGSDPLNKGTISRLIAKLRQAPEEPAATTAPGPRSLPLFGWDLYHNPTAILERDGERLLVARLLPVIDQRLPKSTELFDLQVRWKPMGDIQLDDTRTQRVRDWLAEAVYLALLSAHLVKASPAPDDAKITFRTPYLAWWRFGTLLVTQTKPVLLGVSPEVVAGTSYAGLAWYAPERGWIQGRGLPGLWGHRVLSLANRASDVARKFRDPGVPAGEWPTLEEP